MHYHKINNTIIDLKTPSTHETGQTENSRTADAIAPIARRAVSLRLLKDDLDRPWVRSRRRDDANEPARAPRARTRRRRDVDATRRTKD